MARDDNAVCAVAQVTANVTEVQHTQEEDDYMEAAALRRRCPQAPLNSQPIVGAASASQLLGWNPDAQPTNTNSSSKIWKLCTCNSSSASPLQVALDIMAADASLRPDLYALQEHRLNDSDRRQRFEASNRLRALKPKMQPAQSTGEAVLATSGGVATGTRSHVGRKNWPP